MYRIVQSMEQEKIYEFIKTLNLLKKVFRVLNVTKERQESSAEHSWILAMMAWLLTDQLEKEFHIKIDQLKLIKIVLMHDIVEIEVGDISVWNKEGRVNKKKDEQTAAKKLFSMLPEDLKNEFMDLWEEFENSQTLEAKIAKGVDRLCGPIQRLVSKQGWDDVHANVASLDEIQLPVIEFSQTLKDIYEKAKQEGLSSKLLKE